MLNQVILWQSSKSDEMSSVNANKDFKIQRRDGDKNVA